MTLTLSVIAILTSIVGSICGIGGGILIKPILDSMNIMNVSAVSFLSGCTVLAMAIISVGKSVHGKTAKINKKITPVLGVGAAIGGVVGKLIFSYIRETAGSEELVGLAQAAVLVLINLGTFFYMLQNQKGKIKTRSIESSAVSLGIGLLLGLLSSFLGIGGGPINLAVLSFCFSMNTKEAATNSLCIILLSQIASLVQTFVTATVPQVEPLYLIGMIAGGAIGGFAGQAINKRLSAKNVETLFNALMLVVTAVCVYNCVRFGIAL